MRKTLFELVHFYPGLIIEFQEERFCAVNGLFDLALIYYKPRPVAWFYGVPVQFSFQGMLDQVDVIVAAVGDAEDQVETEFLSWVNGVQTVLGGVHVESLGNAFERVSW